MNLVEGSLLLVSFVERTLYLDDLVRGGFRLTHREKRERRFLSRRLRSFHPLEV